MKILITLLSLLLTACSLITNDSIESDQNSASKIIASARLYLSSGLLGRQEFEQYSLANNNFNADSAIFFECGDLRAGKVKVRSSNVLNLEQDLRDKLSLSMLEIIGMASVKSKLTEKNNQQIANQASLNVTTIDGKNAILALSFREILLTRNELESKFAQLITEIRSIMKQQLNSDQYCENEHFYGLE